MELDDPFVLARFEPLVGSDFVLRTGDGGDLAARLVEARAAKQPPLNGRLPFSLTFVAEPAESLPQSIYRVEHPELDPMDIFLVPVARTAAGLHLEAVFS